MGGMGWDVLRDHTGGALGQKTEIRLWSQRKEKYKIKCRKIRRQGKDHEGWSCFSFSGTTRNTGISRWTICSGSLEMEKVKVCSLGRSGEESDTQNRNMTMKYSKIVISKREEEDMMCVIGGHTATKFYTKLDGR